MALQNTVEVRQSRVLDVLFTGGDFVLNSSGSTLFTTCTNLIRALDVSTLLEK